MTDLRLAAAFRLLGLSPGASPATVETMFKRLAWDAHPDRGGTAGGFNSLREAFTVASSHARSEPCPTCLGIGRTLRSSGWASAMVACASCDGTGKRHGVSKTSQKD